MTNGLVTAVLWMREIVAKTSVFVASQLASEQALLATRE
jgi:hypothetical protein